MNTATDTFAPESHTLNYSFYILFRTFLFDSSQHIKDLWKTTPRELEDFEMDVDRARRGHYRKTLHNDSTGYARILFHHLYETAREGDVIRHTCDRFLCDPNSEDKGKRFYCEFIPIIKEIMDNRGCRVELISINPDEDFSKNKFVQAVEKNDNGAFHQVRTDQYALFPEFLIVGHDRIREKKKFSKESQRATASFNNPFWAKHLIGQFEALKKNLDGPPGQTNQKKPGWLTDTGSIEYSFN